jgi:hypothetical protein
MRPDRVIATAYLRRGAVLWVVTRAALSVLWILAGDHPLRLSVASTVGALLSYVAVGYVETSRRHEWELLANLGIKRRMLALAFLVPAVIGEAVLRAVEILTQ